MAEAYTNSLCKAGVRASSSGIAITNTEWDVSPYAVYATKHSGISGYLSAHKKQTNEMEIETADMIIFMSSDVYSATEAEFDFSTKKYEIWSIEDLGVRFRKVSSRPRDPELAQRLAIETFAEIRSKVDAFVADL